MVTPSATKANCDIAESRDKIWVVYSKGNETNETSFSFTRELYDLLTKRERALQSDPAENMTVLCEDTCDLELYETVDVLIQYNIIPAVVIGLIGTILILITLLPDLKKSSANWYMVVLALTESSWLFYKLMTEFEPMYSALRNTNFSCCFTQVFLQFSEMASVYVLLGMTAERMFVVVKPLSAASKLSMKKSMIVTTVVAACTLSLSMPLVSMFSYTGEDHLGYPLCETNDSTFTWETVDAYFYTLMALTTFIPIFLLFIMNSVIICRIQQYGKEQANLTSSDGTAGCGGKKSSNRQEKQITVMLVTVSVLFLILTVPYAIYYITRQLMNNYVCSQEEIHAIITTTAIITKNFSHAINAYIYCMSSKSFRKQLLGRLGVKSDASQSYVSRTQMTTVSGTVG